MGRNVRWIGILVATLLGAFPGIGLIPSAGGCPVAGPVVEGCISWSEIRWDDATQTHYILATNQCGHDVYCSVEVTRSSGTVTFGWTVGPNATYRFDLGVVGSGDSVQTSGDQ